MEKQIKTLDNDFITEKDKTEDQCLVKGINLLEVEEELKDSIYDLIWFVQPDSYERNDKSVYNPRVGPNNYKNFLKKCFHYIFNQSHKLLEKSETF